MFSHLKNIEAWKYWHTKGKFLYCIFSAIISAIAAFPIYLLIGSLIRKSDTLLSDALIFSAAFFIASLFFSLINWYNYEQRYKEWQKSNEHKVD